MKLIVAIIRPDKLEDVQSALSKQEVYLLTTSDVRGCGRQRGYAENYRGAEGYVRLLSKLKLEIAVNDEQVASVVEAIKTAGKTGKIGDGKIFILPLDGCTRIRTGEEGPAAIGP